MRRRTNSVIEEVLASASSQGRRGYSRSVAVVMLALLLASLCLATRATRALAEDPTKVSVTEVAFKDAADAYLPVSDTDSTTFNLVDALKDSEVSATNPVCKNAKVIEVTVEATVKTDGVDPSSKVELVDKDGKVIGTATFAQKTDKDSGDPIDFAYVAVLDHVDTDPMDPAKEIPEGELGLKVTFKDTAGAALETDDAAQQLSETDKAYEIFGASVKEFDEGGTKIKKVYADGSFEIDRTAPVMTSMGVKPADGSATWALTDDASGKSGTVAINLSTAEARMDPDKSSIILTDLDDESHPTTSLGLTWDSTTKLLTFELPDGHWDIAYKLYDAADNLGSQGKVANVTTDGTAPEASYAFRGQDITDISAPRFDQGGQFVLTVREPHFDKDKTTINVWPTLAEPGFEFTYDKNKWTKVSEGVYTYTIDFDYEGSYNVVLNSEDTFGNKREGSSAGGAKWFEIDGAPPTVTTKFVDTSYSDLSSVSTITSPLSAEVFDARVSVLVTVTDQRIDMSKSTINLRGSVGMGEIKFSDFVDFPDSPMLGAVLKTVSNELVDGIRTIVIEVSYPNDGVFDTPVVSVQDYTHEPVTSRPSESSYLLIDTTAPALSTSISKAPATAADLGTTASGAAIVNGAVNGSGELKNSVWFFKCGVTAQVNLAIDEPYGVKSIEVSDPSGRYALSNDTVEGTRQAGNASIDRAGGKSVFADLALANPLAEGKDFPDNVTVKVTNLAGYSTTWSMSDVGLDMPGEGTVKPTLLVEDDTAPTIELTETIESKDVADAAGQKPEYVRYFNETKTVGAKLTDLTLKYLRGFGSGTEGDAYEDINGFYTGLDGARPIISAVVDSDTANPQIVDIAGFESAGDGKTFTKSVDYDTDGDYEVSIEARDVTGNVASETIEKFTIDKTPPTMTLAFANASGAQEVETDGITFVNGARTATITVKEHNFDPDLFTVDITDANHLTAASGYVAPVVSGWTSTGDTHTCTVEFGTTDHKGDGQYTITVSGQDKACNAAEPQGTYAIGDSLYSGIFVVDTENPIIAKYYNDGEAPTSTFDADDPVVEMPPASGVYEGTNYYAHPITLFALVQDRNFDAEATTLSIMKDGSKATQSISWGRVPDERGENGYEDYRVSIPFEDDGEYWAPLVDTTDFATNHAENEEDAKKHQFVVDTKPPTVKVDVDHPPVSQGRQGAGSDPVNFYNQPTTMTFTVSDEHKLRSVDIKDPDSAYTVSASEAAAEGKGKVTFNVALKDGTTSSDNEYDRVIVLTAEDLAGNQRTWTIDHNGKIVKDEKVSGAWKQVTSQDSNVGINGGGEHPITLVQDTVAPVVGLSGVTAGTYYNKPQTVTATVNELNLDWLKQFDPARTVVTITKYEGSAGRARSSWTVPASSFVGAKPNYSFAQAFSSDGHYVVEAQVRDYATNLSNKATIGEFTIDMTPPQLTMSFDNNDVRNDKYYKAPRTATITVVEHNFDPSLFTIETNGVQGTWQDNGDTHTITVYFGEGGPYTVRVNGRDLADNAATEVSEPEFIVDVTAPKVTIAGTAQRLGYVGDSSYGGALVNAYHGDLKDKSAYNGVVVPVITYTDNEVLSPADLDFALLGSKHGADTDYETKTSAPDREMTINLGDLGYRGPDAGDGSNWENFYVDDYAPDADDIYTINASMTDQAGNEAEATVTFSVNRYGSNYDVHLEGLSTEENDEYLATGMLSEAPTIVVREVNVSGVDDRDRKGNLTGNNHRVEKEFANATTAIKLFQGEGQGYSLEAIDSKDQMYGWSEYVYTVRSDNFGEGSDSDHNDRGQGVYRVNVTSDDTSSNANTTAEFWRSDTARTRVTAAGATAEFILDELPPAIDDLDLPVHLSRGESYEASFHVTDDITSGNTVEVQVDGVTLDASEVQGPSNGAGTFTFIIPAKPFNWRRSVNIVVRDYAGREVSESNPTWIWQSSFIPEGLVLVGVVGAIVAGVVLYRRQKEAAEPELPEW